MWSMAMKSDWVEQICDRVEQQVRKTKGDGATIICASGISPSRPIHLGNLREVMTPHIVAEALRERGLKQAQRSFFIALYQLICERETGPRIPTLLLSLGKEKVKMLLAPQ
jgi:lysyl-tRNA synthetase class I